MASFIYGYSVTPPEPSGETVLILDGDSRFAQAYLLEADRIQNNVQTLLGDSATVYNRAVGGGALNTGSGNLNLTGSASTRLGDLLSGDETNKIVVINTSFNDLMAGKTVAQYMTALEEYCDAVRALGATHVIVFAPTPTDYLGQKSYMRKRFLDILTALKTNVLNFAEGYINPQSDSIIGLKADTHNTDLYWQAVDDSGKLHWNTGLNDVVAVYIAEFVKRKIGITTVPSIPTALEAKPTSQTSFMVTLEPAFDGIAVTRRDIRLNGTTVVDIGTSLSYEYMLATAGTQYDIEIRAVGASGSSGWSSVKTVYTYPNFSGWTPASLTSEIWLDSPFTDTVDGDPATVIGDPIRAVKDESGTSHFTESTIFPSLSPTSLGNKDGWLFTASQKLTNASAGNLFHNDFTWTFLMKASTPTYSELRTLAMCGDLAFQEMRSLAILSFSGDLAFIGYGDNSTDGCNISTEVNVADGVSKYVTIRKTGTLVEIFINKNLVVLARPHLLDFASNLMTLGAFNSEINFYNGYLGESILVPSSVSDLNLHRMMNYMEEVINGIPAEGGLTNFALPANGATASASTTYSGYSPANAINGDRLFSGTDWTVSQNIWHGNLNNIGGGANTDWLEVDFGQSRTIERIDVFTMRDSFTDKNPHVTPNTETFNSYGIVGFILQQWNGTTWVNIESPVTANNKVWYQTMFTPITTTKVRILVNNTNLSFGGYARISEFEVWG